MSWKKVQQAHLIERPQEVAALGEVWSQAARRDNDGSLSSRDFFRSSPGGGNERVLEIFGDTGRPLLNA